MVAGLTGVHESVLRIEGEPNVAVLPAGPNDGWTGLVESESTRQTIEEIERLADFVVLDAPPVLPSADALTLCGVVDAVVLVVRVGHTRKVAIDTALRQLEQVGAPILGVVVNDSRKWSTNDYRYYQYASYSANDEYLGPPVTPDASLQVPEPDPAVPSAT